MSTLPHFLNGQDAAWWKMNEATNLVIITAVIRFAGQLHHDAVITAFEHGLAPFPQFRSRIVGMNGIWGVPRYEEVPHFAVADHVTVVSDTPPVTEDALQVLVGNLMSQPLREERPLWEVFLVEEVTGGTAMIFRLHHCIADGIALVQLLLSLTEGLDATVRTPTRRRQPWYTPLLIALSFIPTAFQLLFMPPDPPTRFRGRLGTEKRAAWSNPISLEKVKAIGRATNSTVNDVLIAAVAGALRTVLGTDVKRDIRAAVPINLRPPGPTPQMGNQIGTVFVPLPITAATPTERLQTLQQRMNGLKRSPQPFITFLVLWLGGVLPNAVARWLAWLLSTKATAVMTNVPGPQQPLSFTGQPITQIMFWVPQAGNVGLGVSLLSYNGDVLVGITTDAGLYPEPERIVEAFEAELQGLTSSLKSIQ